MKRLYRPFLMSALLLIATLSWAEAATTDTLVEANTAWKYLDNGTNQGTTWKDSGFNDAAWATGNAELGYGDGDEATVVGYGGNASNKYITTYFRKTFTVNNPSAYIAMTLQLIRDDGAVVYVNGTEVYRNNMPTGTIAYNTLASSAVTDESTWYSASFSNSLLVTGTNVVAVEMHQTNVTSSDISFNFRLTGSTTPSITRGPYQQTVTPTSIIVRWKTDVATDSRVRCGSSTSNYTLSFYNASLVTDHEMQLTGLSANAQYYYTIENGSTLLQGDLNNHFRTSPVSGSTSAVRIWAIGDFGNNSSGQLAVRDAYVNYTGSIYTNLWLWMGDNAYDSGTDAQYQSNVFDIYKEQMKYMPLYPSPGNHDYANIGYLGASALTTGFPYFTNFTMPVAAEAGGVASGTEKYYSFNYANIHFVALDSYGAYNNSGSAMYNWLVSDLDANTQQWTIVYFHHPPYTKGSHNSDTETELINIRQNIVPVLESHQVDLVLCGHSHTNERSYMIKGHYGLSSSFTNAMIMAGGSGALPTPYVKTSPYDGTVYAVCGTSGQLSGTTQSGFPLSSMYYADKTHNSSMVIDISGDTLTSKYLGSDQSILDQFTIVKSSLALPVTWLTFKAQKVSNTVEVEWATVSELNNDYFTIERSKDGANFEEISRIKGAGSNVQLRDYSYIDHAPFQGVSFYRLRQTDFDRNFSYSEVVAVNMKQDNFIRLSPNPAFNRLDILFTARENSLYTIEIIDAKGTGVYRNEITSEKGSNSIAVNTSGFSDGMYIVKVSQGLGRTYMSRFAKTSK